MKVKQLINELKKMPQGAEVGVSMSDNSEFEIAGWVNFVGYESKEEFDPELDATADTKMIESQPDEWVTLGC